MYVFMVYVRDGNFCQLLPEELNRSRSDDGRIRVMAFPPLGIQTLAPILRQHGHEVRMFDTCHPQMKEEHIAQAVAEESPMWSPSRSCRPPPTRRSKLARRLKSAAPKIPVIVGGVFATINAEEILRTALTSISLRGRG